MKSPWFTVSGVLLAALGLVAAVFGPLTELMTQRTEVENFVATPSNKPGVTAYVLPLDAPLEEMPAGVIGYSARRKGIPHAGQRINVHTVVCAR